MQSEMQLMQDTYQKQAKDTSESGDGFDSAFREVPCVKGLAFAVNCFLHMQMPYAWVPQDLCVHAIIHCNHAGADVLGLGSALNLTLCVKTCAYP